MFAWSPKLGHEQKGWIAPSNAFLVRDLNHDGVINDGSELFGDSTLLKSGATAKDGYEALRDLDDNNDLKLDASDKAFAELLLWEDADIDGVTDPVELASLADHKILSLDLDAKPSDRIDNGNAIKLVSSYTLEDGTTREMADVWFSIAADAIDDPEDDLMSEDATPSESSDPSDPALSPRPASSGEDTNAPSASSMPTTSMPTSSIPTTSAPTPPRGSFDMLDWDRKQNISHNESIEEAIERSLFERLENQSLDDQLTQQLFARI
jgi:hypothetical protein